MTVTRRSKIVVVAALSAALVGAGTAYAARSASSAHKGGKVHIFVTSGKGPHSKIMITGAIGDYGKSRTTDKNGNTNGNGNFEHVVLQRGTFIVHTAKLNHALNNAKPEINKHNCSFYVSGTRATPLTDGTGAYAGISGSPKITITFAFIGPRVTSGKHKGECNQSHKAKPVSHAVSVSGVGNVSFG
jgi:hypothetical protein